MLLRSAVKIRINNRLGPFLQQPRYFLWFYHKTFHILGVNHIAIGSTSKESLQKLWTDSFGCEYVKTFKVKQY